MTKGDMYRFTGSIGRVKIDLGPMGPAEMKEAQQAVAAALLCAGYKKFFRHSRKYLRAMATLLKHDLPVLAVMQAVDAPPIVARRNPGAP